MGNISQHFVGLSGGFMMSIIAFCTVFLVIAGLMLMMMALKKFAGAMEAREAAQSTTAPAAPEASASAPAKAAAASTEDDSELIAAITAAVTAMTGTAARIVSFKPSAPYAAGSTWKMTGILQNSEGFAD